MNQAFKIIRKHLFSWSENGPLNKVKIKLHMAQGVPELKYDYAISTEAEQCFTS